MVIVLTTLLFLSQASQDLAPDLEHFVLFSSIASLFGNVGQVSLNSISLC